MRADELKGFLKQRPFEPIRLHLSSGEHVDIRHPDMAIVAKSLVAIGVDDVDGVADYLVHYNLIHVVKIEPLNGQRSKGRQRRG